ncbi:MAG: hypothetical protein K2Y10_07145 [Burkholderiaceae bacterium]|nr:hypothetical protein [Burkholderiaceae bacterium]
MKNIAQALPHQPTWKDCGRMDLRQIDVSLLEAAPRLLAGADGVAGAVDVIRQAMGVVLGGQIKVKTRGSARGSSEQAATACKATLASSGQ